MTFLREQSSVGESVSQGQFTVAREKAVVKMAEYQFPFAEAWAIKVVQALVAAGPPPEIKVTLTNSEARFTSPTSRWTCDQVEQAFFDPNASGNPTLKHLMLGLWSVAVHDQRAFQLCLAGQSESLVWNGQRLSRVEYPQGHSTFSLSVSHGQAGPGLTTWLTNNLGQSRQRNADLLSALSEYCFPCPVPLTVDGRRLDALQFAVSTGWLQDSVPVGLCLGAEDAALPEFGIPPGTYQDIVSYARLCEGQPAWRALGRSMLEGLCPQPSASLALLLTVCPDESSRLRETWSKVLWVQDGALIDAEPLFDTHSFGVAGCFLSAADLKTDLSTFQLVQSQERTRRLSAARRLTRDLLGQVIEQRTFAVEDSGGDPVKKTSLGLIVLGLGTVWAAPVLGAGMIASGVYGYKHLANDPASRGKQVREAMRALRRRV